MKLGTLLFVVGPAIRVVVIKEDKIIFDGYSDLSSYKEFGDLNVVLVEPQHTARENYLVVEVAE